MASQQLNKSEEREVHVEKDKVPKLASHFEAIAVKDSGDQSEKTQGQKMQKEGGGVKGPSLEEISKYRGIAQQNSMEAILAAQDKYQKSKATMEKGLPTGQQAKDEGSFEYDQRTGGGGGGGGVIRVIGETLFEIGKNTKDMLVGEGGGAKQQQQQQLGEESCGRN